jgi:trimeric autotransporter adhesin
LQVTYDNRVDEFPSYNFADSRQMGWIADDVAELIPELVYTDADGYKHISYSRSVAVLGEAIKELAIESQKKQSEYETLIQKQQKELDELRALVTGLMTEMKKIHRSE